MTPMLKQLRKLSTGHRITLLCRKSLGAIFIENGLVDDLIEYDKLAKQKSDSSACTWSTVTSRVLAQTWHTVVCPHESIRTHWLMARVRAQQKIGFKKFWNRFIFDQRIVRPMMLPEALRQLSLLESLDTRLSVHRAEFLKSQSQAGGQDQSGALTPVPEWASMQLYDRRHALSEFHDRDRDIEIWIERAQLRRKKSLFLAPGSVWATKMWAREGFIEVAQHFAKYDFQIVILGSSSESELANAIVARVASAISIAGETSISQSARLLSYATALVCNDSGAMHLAALSELPTVAVFGPTVLEFGYRPWQNWAIVVQPPAKSLSCRPCGSHGAKKCRLGTHECMTQLTSAQVITEVTNLLRQ